MYDAKHQQIARSRGVNANYSSQVQTKYKDYLEHKNSPSPCPTMRYLTVFQGRTDS